MKLFDMIYYASNMVRLIPTFVLVPMDKMRLIGGRMFWILMLIVTPRQITLEREKSRGCAGIRLYSYG